MATGKPLELIVDESLFDLPEVQQLVEQGHTIRKLMQHGYDGILGPKASNLTAEDIKANPKLLEIALLKFKEMKYPAGVKPAKVAKGDTKKGKGKKDGMDNQEAPARPTEAGPPEEAPPSKRRTRRTKQQIADDNRRAIEAAGGEAVNPGAHSTGDTVLE